MWIHLIRIMARSFLRIVQSDWHLSFNIGGRVFFIIQLANENWVNYFLAAPVWLKCFWCRLCIQYWYDTDVNMYSFVIIILFLIWIQLRHVVDKSGYTRWREGRGKGRWGKRIRRKPCQLILNHIVAVGRVERKQTHIYQSSPSLGEQREGRQIEGFLCASICHHNVMVLWWKLKGELEGERDERLIYMCIFEKIFFVSESFLLLLLEI